MIKYIIVDDEFMAQDIIKGYADLLPKLQWMKSCNDAIEAIEYLNENKVDLIFLDLNMPKLTGFDFLKTLIAPPKVIVTTAHKEHALEGYELNIVDYLLKPFSFERFLKAVNKVMLSKPTSGNDNGEIHKSSLFLKSEKKYFQVFINDILYIEAAGNYSKVMLENTTILVREKISDLIKSLPDTEFMQVHKSFAIAKQYIDSIEGNRIFIGKHEIPIGNMFKSNIAGLLK